MKRFVHNPAGLSVLFTLVLLGIATFVLPTPSVIPKVRGQNKSRQVILEAKVGIPRLPISIVEFKNLQSDTWIKDLEIHIKNKSQRPIYFIGLNFGFPEVTIGGAVYGFSAPVGDSELRYEGEKAKEANEPLLLPGKELSIKLPEKETKWFALHLSRIGMEESSVKKILMDINQISFGDGTGVQLTDPKWKINSLISCRTQFLTLSVLSTCRV